MLNYTNMQNAMSNELYQSHLQIIWL